jgi:UV DNA damage endonuclease
MMRLGLCCKFHEEPIRFRTATARYTGGLSSSERMKKLSLLCLENARSLLQAIKYCSSNNIGCFRVNSQIFPLKTHPKVGYAIDQLPDAQKIREAFAQCRELSARHNIRLSFHPDQFILLSSPDEDIVRNSIAELDYQAEVSEMIGADVINIHGGGAYGDKASALKRAGKVLSGLNKRIRARLTLENDDRVYTPQDLLPFCKEHKIPFVYDVHHHRCLPDGLNIKQATSLALKTWNREPLFHLSSPKLGWGGAQPNFHHDYIDVRDFPKEWRDFDITVEVEAKAKELAIKKLYKDLGLGSRRAR